ncbi:unnamed protein product [Prunus armeniaca]|uniref:Uncharacterized protein n=1 Tax=Prunus armeniaca TaxID=36596 RepID=A0A6J5U595_PRUAR|nr:unnamed protein product [Prunus armeniaca]CAB4301888.1 unnamed protein product [Prunus armeniaca]
MAKPHVSVCPTHLPKHHYNHETRRKQAVTKKPGDMIKQEAIGMSCGAFYGSKSKLISIRWIKIKRHFAVWQIADQKVYVKLSEGYCDIVVDALPGKVSVSFHGDHLHVVHVQHIYHEANFVVRFLTKKGLTPDFIWTSLGRYKKYKRGAFFKVAA